MKKIKKVISMILYNIWTLVGFESAFKVISFFIFTPLFFHIFDLIMTITGYRYLTMENIFSFLTNPLTFFMLLILIFLMTIYTMFDITTIIVILDGSYQKKKVKIIDAVRISLNKCRKYFHYQNIPLAFFILFLIPFLNMGLAPNFITTIKIPEFIIEFVITDRFLFPILIILLLILTAVLLRWIYSLHYFVLEESSFKEARKKSIALGKKSHVKDLIAIFLVQGALTIFYFLFVIVGILIIIGLDKILGNMIVKSITTTIIWVFIAISFILFMVLSTPISYASISVLYYIRKYKKNEEVKNISFRSSSSHLRINLKLKKLAYLFSLVAIVFASIFTYGVYKGSYNLNIEHVRTQEVTAHRGASREYPENTMISFIAARDLGADWIELDVQQTKDGKIIVIHDANFKRTTGVNKHTWELAYEEVEKLDAGSFKDKKFKGEKIPLLEDVIVFAKNNNIRLNIELKPNGHETDFEKTVIDIITKYSFKENCVITSQEYDVLERIKKYDSTIETVYVMSLAYGDITTLKYADHFSIEATSVTSALVNRVHKEGKELYVWTINVEDNMRKMIDLGVDNIITDDIKLAKDTIYSSKTSNLINEYVNFIDKIF